MTYFAKPINPILDWSHPHSDGLVFALPQAPVLRELALRAPLTLNGSASSAAYDLDGWGLYLPDTPGDYITCGDRAEWDFPTAFTWAVRVKFETLRNGAIASKIASTYSAGWIFQMFNAQIRAFVNGNPRATVSGAVTTGIWYWLHVVWDGGTIYIYVDGEMRGSGAYSTAPNSSGYTMNYNRFPVNNDCDATHADFRMWERAWTAREITAFIADPWAAYRQDRSVVGMVTAAPTFSPAWARGSNVIIQPGVQNA